MKPTLKPKPRRKRLTGFDVQRAAKLLASQPVKVPGRRKIGGWHWDEADRKWRKNAKPPRRKRSQRPATPLLDVMAWAVLANEKVCGICFSYPYAQYLRGQAHGYSGRIARVRVKEVRHD